MTKEPRVKRAERKVAKAKERSVRREMKRAMKGNPPFVAVLHGVDPQSDRPPPYQNVRVNIRAS